MYDRVGADRQRNWNMKLKEILAQIDEGILVLPQFQRGFVWKRKQVRNLMVSLYKDYPIGSMLVWKTKADPKTIKGASSNSLIVNELLLDGQQRLTSLYGIVRGKRPAFSNANDHAFLNLYFNVDTQEFEFYGPTKMQHNPRWVSVTDVMRKDLGQVIQPFMSDRNLSIYIDRIQKISNIKNRDFHVESMTDQDKSMDVIVDIFNQVNSGGTQLSKGDLALAKICADWPQARDEMQRRLDTLAQHGYDFNLDWLLRCINGLVTGHADFAELERQEVTVEQIQDGLRRATTHIDTTLNLLASRLGLDHSYVLGSPNSLIALLRFFDRYGKHHDQRALDRLCYWYVHALLWQRYSGPVETRIRQDIMAVDDRENPVGSLIDRLRDHRWPLRVETWDLTASKKGGRFYSLLYMLTRVYGARDFCKGIELKKSLLGKGNQLELHHIFPKYQLNKFGSYIFKEVNAQANFTFLTKDCNLQISAKLPKDYFAVYEAKHPGVLASHWIPVDRRLWEVDNYRDFLAARRELLAQAANDFLDQLYHGNMPAADRPAFIRGQAASPRPISIESDEEEVALHEAMAWMEANRLPRGQYGFELVAPNGEILATLDLAWPRGIQTGLSRPAALLIDESEDTRNVAEDHDFKCFTSLGSLQRYVQSEILDL